MAYLETETEIRNAARAKWANRDDIEIDADAKVNAATDGGSWVAAWLYISNEELDEAGDAQDKPQHG
jgi:hypothetical protein